MFRIGAVFSVLSVASAEMYGGTVTMGTKPPGVDDSLASKQEYLSEFYGTDPNGDTLNCSIFTGTHLVYGTGSIWMNRQSATPGKVFIVDSMFYAFNGGSSGFPKNAWDPSQNVNPCDPSTFLDPTPGFYSGGIGIVADTYAFTCLIIPDSPDALGLWDSFGFQALIWYTSSVSNGPKAFWMKTMNPDKAFSGAFLVATAFSAHVQDGKMKDAQVLFSTSSEFEWPAGEPGNLYGDTCDLGGKKWVTRPLLPRQWTPRCPWLLISCRFSAAAAGWGVRLAVCAPKCHYARASCIASVESSRNVE